MAIPTTAAAQAALVLAPCLAHHDNERTSRSDYCRPIFFGRFEQPQRPSLQVSTPSTPPPGSPGYLDSTPPAPGPVHSGHTLSPTATPFQPSQARPTLERGVYIGEYLLPKLLFRIIKFLHPRDRPEVDDFHRELWMAIHNRAVEWLMGHARLSIERRVMRKDLKELMRWFPDRLDRKLSFQVKQRFEANRQILINVLVEKAESMWKATQWSGED